MEVKVKVLTMKGVRIVTTIVCASVLFGAFTARVLAESNVSIFLGQKSLEKEDWEPVESQNEFGVGFEHKGSEWPVSVMVSYFHSKAFGYESELPDLEIEGETKEFSVGARKSFSKDKMRFFIDAGLASISATAAFNIRVVDTATISVLESDSGFGTYFGLGADALLSDAFSIGILVGESNAKVTLFDESFKAGGTHFGIFAAYYFGK